MVRFNLLAFVSGLLLAAAGCSGSAGVHPADREYFKVPENRQDAWHTMRKGETFHSLSRTYGVPAAAIATANPLMDPTSIPVGARVLIPGGEVLAGPPLEPSVAKPKPVKTPDRGRLRYPVLGTAVKSKRPTPGLEFATELNATVVCADSGIVVLATSNLAGLGPTVMVDHGEDLCTMYACLSDYSVRVGQRVSRGEPLGRSGAMGLLFRVYRGPIALAPDKYLNK